MQRVTKHGAIFIAAYIATAIINYSFGVGLSWFLSPAQFGMLGVAQSLLLMLALAVGSSFAWTANHDLSSIGLNTKSRTKFRTAFLMNVLTGVLAAILLWFAYRSGILKLDADYQVVILLIGITTLILAARAVLNGAARGLQKFNPVALNLIGEVLVKAVLGIALVALGLNVVGVLVAFALGAFISLLHSLWIVRGNKLWSGTGWFDKQVIFATLPMFVGMVSVAFVLNLDIIGLKILTPTNQSDILAGYYQAAVILARTPVFIAQAVTLVLFSYVASSMNKLSSSNKIYPIVYFRTALKTWYRLLLPGGLILILSPKSALSIFFPDNYQNAARLLQVAALGCILLALVTLFNGILQASNRKTQAAMVLGLATITQIIFMAILIPKIGPLGSPLSLLIAGSIGLLGLLSSLRDELNELISSYNLALNLLQQIALPILALIFPLILLPDGGRWMSFFKILLSGLFYLMVLFGMQMQRTKVTKRPITSYLNNFVRVLLGG